MEKRSNKLLHDVLSGEIDPQEFARKKAQIDAKLPPADNHNYCGSISTSPSNIGHITPDKLKAFMAEHPVATIVDVREPHEFDAYPEECISGKQLVNIPLSQLTNFVNRHRKDNHDGTFVCICRSGNRSDAAARTLSRYGFNHVYHVPGGFALLS